MSTKIGLWTICIYICILASFDYVYSLLSRLNRGIFLSFLLNMFSTRGQEWQLIYPSEAFYPRSADYPCFKRHSREDPSQEVVFQPNTAPRPQIPNTLLRRHGNQYHKENLKIIRNIFTGYRITNLDRLQTTKTIKNIIMLSSKLHLRYI